MQKELFVLFLFIVVSLGKLYEIAPRTYNFTMPIAIDRATYLTSITNPSFEGYQNEDFYQFKLSYPKPGDSICNIVASLHALDHLFGFFVPLDSDYVSMTIDDSEVSFLFSFPGKLLRKSELWQVSIQPDYLLYAFELEIRFRGSEDRARTLTTHQTNFQMRLNRHTLALIEDSIEKTTKNLCSCKIRGDLLSKMEVCSSPSCIKQTAYAAGTYTYGSYIYLHQEITSEYYTEDYTLQLERVRVMWDGQAMVSDITEGVQSSCLNPQCKGGVVYHIPLSVVASDLIFLVVSRIVPLQGKGRLLADEEQEGIQTKFGPLNVVLNESQSVSSKYLALWIGLASAFVILALGFSFCCLRRKLKRKSQKQQNQNKDIEIEVM
jgi:hypothetical protein